MRLRIRIPTWNRDSPVLASLRLPCDGHVVSLIGHTMDLSKDVGAALEFVDSSHFLKQFVVVDDNCFPYRTLGYEGDAENYAKITTGMA